MLRSSSRSISPSSTLTWHGIAVALPELLDQPLDARKDAQVERRGPQGGRDVPNGLDDVVYPPLQLANLLDDPRRGLAGLQADGRQVHLESRERLPHLVVDLARDVCALSLAHGIVVRRQLAQQLLMLLERFFGVLPFGDVYRLEQDELAARDIDQGGRDQGVAHFSVLAPQSDFARVHGFVFAAGPRPSAAALRDRARSPEQRRWRRSSPRAYTR